MGFRASGLAARVELIPGVGAPDAGDHLPDRFGDQRRLILVNVVPALVRNEEAGVRHELACASFAASKSGSISSEVNPC